MDNTIGQQGFEQPYIHSFGYVTSAGAKDTSKFFLPYQTTVTHNGAGVYKITHNIGSTNLYNGSIVPKYEVMVTPVSSSAAMATVKNINPSDVEVCMFDAAGNPASTAFSFAIYSF